MAIVCFLFALLTSPKPAHAATIFVDGDCTLVKAIENANDTDNGHPNTECASGDPSGADTIVLTGNNYSYTAPNGTSAALPNITSEIIIEANGATIERTSGTMRIFNVTGTGNLTLNNASIMGGVVSGSLPSNQGGGLYVQSGGTATLNNSTISGNETTTGNGGGIRNSGTTTLNSSTIKGNSASLSGGGIANDGAVILNNSTVSGNMTDGSGGGIRNYGSGTVTLNNSTINDNTAGNQGGGISSSGNWVALARTIVSGNTANSGGDEVHIQLGTASGNNYNVIGYGGSSRSLGFTPSGSDVVPTGALDTVLETMLADNGGSTLTHALVTGSPAVDIAPAADCDSVDQRGVFRSQDGTANGTAACDAGAIELGQLQCGLQAASQPTFLTFADASNVLVDVVNDGTDLDCVRVTEIGHNHPDATSAVSNMALETGRYWQIAGLQNNTAPTLATEDFGADLTLPFANADANSRVCRWLEGAGPGFGWDCGPLDGTGTSNIANTSVTREGLSSFSDWAVGDEVGPTSIALHTFAVSSQPGSIATLFVTLLIILSLAWLWARGQLPDRS